jgi:hypothetical protein
MVMFWAHISTSAPLWRDALNVADDPELGAVNRGWGGEWAGLVCAKQIMLAVRLAAGTTCLVRFRSTHCRAHQLRPVMDVCRSSLERPPAFKIALKQFRWLVDRRTVTWLEGHELR